MKTAFSTLACPTLGLQDVLALAEKNQIDAVEIRLDKEHRMCGYGLENVSEAKRILEKSKVVLSDLATGISFRGGEDKSDAVEQCARLAKALGAPAIRVFANATSKDPAAVSAEETAGIVASLQKGADVAARYGIQLWIETHSAYSTGRSVAALVRAVQRDNVFVIWDVLHSLDFGESLEERVACLGSMIAHVHLKDGVAVDGEEAVPYRLTALGEGSLSFSTVLKLLSGISYNGYFSLEWELMWHPELREFYESDDALLEAYLRVLTLAE